MDSSQATGPPKTLHERFPSLSNLGSRWRQRSIPFVQQMTTADCGAACLTMVLQYHGCAARLGEIRDRLSIGRDGTSARALVDTAQALGLRGRVVRIDVPDLAFIPRGSILHWRMDHFVVFDRLRRGGALVVDPAAGRRIFTSRELGDAFTGVALLFDKPGEFRTVRRHRPLWSEYLERLMAHKSSLAK
ncbi:MAG: peptidase domain-containing ABC transporter, partial [Candidatus Eisenbacteria bacterium]